MTKATDLGADDVLDFHAASWNATGSRHQSAMTWWLAKQGTSTHWYTRSFLPGKFTGVLPTGSNFQKESNTRLIDLMVLYGNHFARCFRAKSRNTPNRFMMFFEADNQIFTGSWFFTT
jgi:hypothetical protein